MAEKKKDPADPSTTSAAWDSMIEKWLRIETLLGGTDAMREAGQTYLPRHDQETDANYTDRLQSATLFNMLELTLDTLVGKPFSDPVVFKDETPEPIAELGKDIDLQGSDISSFCREWFREGMAKAFAHVLVDFPSLSEEERAGRTLADDRRDNRRPYWVLIKPERVIDVKAEVVGGQERITHFRFVESMTVRDGFAERVVERIRVLEPGRFEVWEKQEKGRNRKRDKWVVVEQGETGLDFVPVVTFYSNRQDLALGKPPLDDLVHLNIRHWQSTSDQINILTVARFPMLAVSGATDQTGNVMAIGPRQLLGTRDPNGKFYYVEHDGRAIEAGRQDLMDLEEMMASYGAEFLKRRPGNATATSRALDSAESTSTLQDHVIRFVDAVNKTLKVTAAWMNLDEGGAVDITTDFSMGGADAAALRTLLTARYGDNRQPGDLSREDFLAELRRMGILGDDFDPRSNLARLMIEAESVGFDSRRVDSRDFLAPGNEQGSDTEGGEDGDE